MYQINFFKVGSKNTYIKESEPSILKIDGLSTIEQLDEFNVKVQVQLKSTENIIDKTKIYQADYCKIDYLEQNQIINLQYETGIYYITSRKQKNKYLIELYLEVNYINEINNFTDKLIIYKNQKLDDNKKLTKDYYLDHLSDHYKRLQKDYFLQGFYVLTKTPYLNYNYYNADNVKINLNILLSYEGTTNNNTAYYKTVYEPRPDKFKPIFKNETTYYLFYVSNTVLNKFSISELFNKNDIIKVYPSFYNVEVEGSFNEETKEVNFLVNGKKPDSIMTVIPFDSKYKPRSTNRYLLWGNTYLNEKIEDLLYIINISEPFKIQPEFNLNFDDDCLISLTNLEDTFIRNKNDERFIKYNEIVSYNNITFEFLQIQKSKYTIFGNEQVETEEVIKRLSKSVDNIIELDNTDKRSQMLNKINNTLALTGALGLFTGSVLTGNVPSALGSGISLVSQGLNTINTFKNSYKQTQLLNATSDLVDILNNTFKISITIFRDNLNSKYRGFKNKNFGFQAPTDRDFIYEVDELTLNKYTGKYDQTKLIEKLNQIRIINER